MEISKLVAVFEADTSNFDAGSSRVNRGLQDSERNASTAGASFSNLDSKLKSIGSGMQAVGATLTAALTLPIVGAGYAILSAGTQYETALNTLQGVTRATSDEMKLAGETARALGADVSLPATSAKDAALAMLELGKAGLTVTQAMEASKGVLQLAAAGQLEEARAAEITANALNAFSLAASESVRVSDLLAAAANASSAGVGDIAMALAQSGATFAAAKVPIEDLTTSIAMLANAGIKGSDAGTSLKTFLSSILAPSDGAASALENLKIKVFNLDGTFKGMPKIIGEFEKALSGLNDQAKIGAIDAIFGSDASRAATILFKAGADGFASLKTAATQAGAGADLAASQTKGLGGAWDALKSQLETIGIDIYNRIAPTLTQIAQAATQVVGQIGNAFAQLSPNLQVAAIAFAGIAAAIGPVVLAAGAFIASLSTIAAFAGFASISAAFSAITPFILPVIAAVAAVGLAAVALYAAWQRDFGGIQETTETVFNAVKETVSAAMEAVSGIVTDIGGGVVNWWNQNYPLIQETVATVSNAIKIIVADFLAAVKEFWEAHGGQIMGIVKSIWNTIKDIVTPALQIIGNIIKLAMQVINGDWSGAWDTLIKITSQAIASAVSFFRELHVKTVQILDTLVKAWAKLSYDAAMALVTGIKNGVVWVYEAFATLPDKIRSLIPVMIAAGANIGSAIWKGLKDGLAGSAASAPIPAQITGQSGFMKGDSASTGVGFRYANLAQLSQANDTNSLANPFTGVSAAASAAAVGVGKLKGAMEKTAGHAKKTRDKIKEIADASNTWSTSALRVFTQNQGMNASGSGVRPLMSNKNSKHGPKIAQALDVPTTGKTVAQIVEFYAKSIKAGIRVVDERIRPPGSKDWSGAHAHLEENDKKKSFFNQKLDYGGRLEELQALDAERIKGNFNGVADALKQVKPQTDLAKEAIAAFADQYARLNVTTREGEVRLDILKGKYGSLTPAVEKMLIASAAQMDMAEISKASFSSTTDILTKLNDAFIAPQTEIEKLNALLTLNNDSDEEAARFYGVIDAMAKMAEQAKLTAKEFGAMLRLKAMVKDDVMPTFVSGAGRGTATGKGIGFPVGESGKPIIPELPQINLPAPPIAPWDTFWGGIKAGMSGLTSDLPNLKTGLQSALIDLPSRAADIFANSIAKFDGTLKGFFKSVVAGFAQMVKEILIEQLRLQVIQGITKIIGAIAGGAAGGGGLTTTAGGAGVGVGGQGLSFARAMGGPVEAGKSYMVGEKEPELFVPRTSGQIYNQAQMGEMGGKTVNNTNNFNFYADPKTGAFSKESANQSAKRLGAMTADALRRA